MIYGVEEIDDTTLSQWAQIACREDNLATRALGEAVTAITGLQHALRDPNFLYAGSRIHRMAIISRNEQIEGLIKQIGELEQPAAGATE